MEENKVPTSEQQPKEDYINIYELLWKMLEKWHLFAICVVVALLFAFVITKYSVPQYETEATLLIKNNENLLGGSSALSGLIGSDAKSNFQNQVGIIQSKSLVKRTIKALDFYTTTYQKVNFHNSDIYKSAPFEVEVDLYRSQPVGVLVDVNLLNANSCEISYKSKDNVPLYDYAEDCLAEEKVNVKGTTQKVKYGEWVSTGGMRFKISLKDPQKWDETYSKLSYAFVINDLNAVVKQFSSLVVSNVDKDGSIVALKMKHENPEKAKDFVNMLCKLYIDATFEEKNHINVATIEFVNSQINSISDSLNAAERHREAFQKNNNTLNLTNDAAYLYERTKDLEVEKAQIFTQRSYYNALEDYVNKADLEGSIAVPSTMGIEDPILNKLVETMTMLKLEKDRLLTTLTPKSPKIKELTTQIETTRKQIQESLKTINKHLDITQKELKRQQNLLQSEIDKLPSTQRNMINIERQFKFNDEIYNFLYQKRAEAEIAKNAAIPDHKIIDAAEIAQKVYPKTAINFLIAILLGLAGPAAYIFIRVQMNKTIENKEDLEKISTSPILGYIPQLEEGSVKMVMFNRSRSFIADSFRSIRTNIKFVLNSKGEQEGGKVILVTSTAPNEGKSSISMNIASVFSLQGKKTLLLEYDLRKPRLHKFFHLDATKGISSYLISQNTLDEVIHHTEFENFDVLCSGPVPPNATELIDSDKNKELLSELRKRYDYIVIDTPPTSLFSDAQCLLSGADVNLYVVRAGETDRNMLRISLNELTQRSDAKVYFIMNGVKTAMQKYGYSYGYGKRAAYGYGYGYGYGYYGEADTRKGASQKKPSKKK